MIYELLYTSGPEKLSTNLNRNNIKSRTVSQSENLVIVTKMSNCLHPKLVIRTTPACEGSKIHHSDKDSIVNEGATGPKYNLGKSVFFSQQRRLLNICLIVNHIKQICISSFIKSPMLHGCSIDFYETNVFRMNLFVG